MLTFFTRLLTLHRSSVPSGVPALVLLPLPHAGSGLLVTGGRACARPVTRVVAAVTWRRRGRFRVRLLGLRVAREEGAEAGKIGKRTANVVGGSLDTNNFKSRSRPTKRCTSCFGSVHPMSCG